MRGHHWWIGTILAVSACSERPTIVRGETVILVDTDLPVPDVVTRARVDVFAEDGRWVASRDVLAADKSEWPFSFGLAAGDRPERRLVRVRVFPHHQLRDYRGAEPPTQPAPTRDHEPSETIEEMCVSPPELRLGEEVTLRFGTVPLTSLSATSTCTERDGSSLKLRGGAAAARVAITEPGSYHFEVTRTIPQVMEVVILLRRECGGAESEIACTILASGRSLEAADLTPGTYSLVATTNIPLQPAEVTLRATREGTSNGPVKVDDVSASEAVGPIGPAWPRLVAGARDVTPLAEPRVEVTSDVLAFVDVVPGERRTVHLSADGACLAKRAELAVVDEQRIDIAGARGCVGGAITSPPRASHDASRDDGRGSTRAGTFFTPAACAETEPTRVCVPGGMFVMGSALFGSTGVASPTPERVAAIETFYVDRDELSVADHRALIAAGPTLDSKLGATRLNDGPLDASNRVANELCTYSRADLGREDHPVNCVTWSLARALCERRGGDLPTEAMWEYMARKAGRTTPSIYPWGDEDPTCELAVHDRLSAGLQGPGTCELAPGGMIPQPRAASANDVNPLGIRGLGGSMGEWCRDAFAPYDHECWRRAPLLNPSCELEFAPLRSVRGGCWTQAPYLLASALRDANAPMQRSSTVGFRCVYGAP